MLQGPVDQWADELTNLALTYRFDSFILRVEGESQLERFAGELIPMVREQVDAERA